MGNVDRFKGFEVTALNTKFQTLGTFEGTNSAETIIKINGDDHSVRLQEYHESFIRVSFKEALEILGPSDTFRVRLPNFSSYCSGCNVSNKDTLTASDESGNIITFKEDKVLHVDIFLTPTEKYRPLNRSLEIGEQVVIEQNGIALLAQVVDCEEGLYSFSYIINSCSMVFNLNPSKPYRIWGKVLDLQLDLYNLKGFTISSFSKFDQKHLIGNSFLLLKGPTNGLLTCLNINELNSFQKELEGSFFYVLITENP